MTSKIETFTNHDGQVVHATFADVRLNDGRTVSQHQGTFATSDEAAQRLTAVQNGWKPSFWEDEPE